MYIRLEGDEHLLVRTVKGDGGIPREVVLARLGPDPELNLFLSAQVERRKHPELWEGVEDYHLLQALETFKRRIGRQKPALVVIDGKKGPTEADREQ